MKYLGFTVFLTLCNFSFSCGQDPSRFSLRFSSGLTRNTSKDQLLNYYTYSGYAWRSVRLDCSFGSPQNYFLLDFMYVNSTLNAKQVNPSFYDYNYVSQWYGDFSLGYYRTIWRVNPRFSIHLGAANHAYIAVLKENFKNTLYNYATSFRKSYDASLFNLSPQLFVTYHVSKHRFGVNSGYTIIHLAARPDDNFVKQIGQSSPVHWRFYSIRDYVNFQVSACYHYQLFKHTEVSLEYNLTYLAYTTPSDFKYLQRCLFAGIIKSF